MIKSPLNVPALQARKNLFPSERLAQDQIRPSFNFSNSEGKKKKKNKVENQPGLLSEGMKGNREVREGWRRHRGSSGPKVGRKCWEFLQGGSCLIIVFKGVSGRQDMTEISHSAAGSPLHQSSEEMVEKATGQSK